MKLVWIIIPLILIGMQESVHSVPFVQNSEDSKDLEPIYVENPNNPEELILDLNAIIKNHDLNSKDNSTIRIEDPTFDSQILQTGETFTLQGSLTAIIIEGLGAILIALFIILYAVKKRIKKKNIKENEN